LSNALSTTARFWLEGVLARLGLPESRREECAANGFVNVADVSIEFLQPASGDKGYVVARAVVGEVLPPGECEKLYQLALEVQGMLCGPCAPVLGLDWPSRLLLVSASIDMTSVSAEDAASILCSVQQMALQWREAIAGMKNNAAAPAKGQPVRIAAHN
jgi:hypothetical protein